MADNPLFTSFEPIRPEQWKEQILKDLKGKDFEKTLVSKTTENINIQAFYTERSEHPIDAFRETSRWNICAPVHISDTAQLQAIKNLVGGADSIHFIGKNENIHVETITQNIDMDIAPVSFQDVIWSDSDIGFWTKNKKSVSHLGIQPLYKLHLGITDSYDASEIVQWAKIRLQTQAQWGILTIDGSIYKNSGGHFIDEVAFIISSLQENLHQLRQNQISSDTIGTIQIRTAVGPNFFFEIAKIKTIRHLSQLIVEQYEGAKIEILAESSELYRSYLDTPTQILRTTTEAMSAILGGADTVLLHPFDTVEGTDFSQRISRNVHHLLIEESYFDKHKDPIRGNFYIDHLIQDLMTASWNVFLSIEKFNGYIHSFVGKSIPEFFIFRHKLAQMNAVAFKRTVLLGTNLFPNIQDALEEKNIPNVSELNSKILQSYRLSEPFELLRWRTQQYRVTHESPKAFLWEFGNVKLKKARSNFAFNFLATAGIPAYEFDNSENFNATIQYLNTLRPEIVVFCSDNESWESFLPKAIGEIPQNVITILAGKNEVKGIDFSIYEGCNIVETLDQILLKLGID